MCCLLLGAAPGRIFNIQFQPAVPVIADVSLVLVIAGLAASTAFRKAGLQPDAPADVLAGELVA